MYMYIGVCDYSSALYKMKSTGKHDKCNYEAGLTLDHKYINIIHMYIYMHDVGKLVAIWLGVSLRTRRQLV